QSGKRGERLAADARRQVHPGQVHRQRANRADTVEAQLHPHLGADPFQGLELVEDSRGRFAMCRPEPAQLAMAQHPAPNLHIIERLSPSDLMYVTRQTLSRGVVDEAVSELTVAQDHASSLEQRQLRTYGVVGQAAGAQE